MRLSTIIFIIILLVIIGIQFIEVKKTNPPVTADLNAPMEVKTIFQKSCYDCHSNETKWPWYSKVAPVSWLVSKDVEEGREHLNFSDWEKLLPAKQRKLKEEIWEEIEEDKMPLGNYTLLHPSAKLDLMKKQTIKKWAVGN
ncbi:heme-binding domain-containing protein [Stygiobacter electus]|uniref:Heme-binding domain-containing protein n=1 Tax=Stygiobacter electus TaxID=3032292 RepID=A0AAE3NZN4_9BACT|nr:heme-binding domain-containing protein [Stygiobacter electus]MDF1612981.1 heme-binding domain-containing protein [Stygiobacter electus]